MFVLIIFCIIAWFVYKSKQKKKYKELEDMVFADLGISGWLAVPFIDVGVTVKSRQSLGKYDELKYFKENENALNEAENGVSFKEFYEFLNDNFYGMDSKFKRLYKKKIEPQVRTLLKNSEAYRIKVAYITPAGKNPMNKIISLYRNDIEKYLNDPTLLMNKSELNRYLKEQAKKQLEAKQHEYYDKVNKIVDLVNDKKDSFVIKGSGDKVDDLIGKLFDRTVNSIKKIKTADSEEWDIIEKFIANIQSDIEKEVARNKRIVEYYESDDFKKINDTYGHNCGDYVLNFIAQKMKNICSKCVMSRWGGEEFLIHNGTHDSTHEVLEKLRREIENSECIYKQQKINISLTIGVAQRNADGDIEEWIKRADDRLYYGKNNGKNMVVD